MKQYLLLVVLVAVPLITGLTLVGQSLDHAVECGLAKARGEALPAGCK